MKRSCQSNVICNNGFIPMLKYFLCGQTTKKRDSGNRVISCKHGFFKHFSRSSFEYYNANHLILHVWDDSKLTEKHLKNPRTQ